MRLLIALLLALLLQIQRSQAASNAENLSLLNQCVSQVEQLDSSPARLFFPRGVFAWQAQGLSSAAEQLREIERLGSHAAASEYLFVNALESCRSVVSKMESLARMFNRFLMALVLTLVSLTTYILVIGVPSKLGLPDRRKRTNSSEPPPHDRKVSAWWILFFIPSLLFGKDTLVVFGYDSFFGKGSLGELVATRFEEKYQVKVKNVSFSSEGEALNQIVLKGNKSEADLLVGVDNGLLKRAVQSGRFVKSEKVDLNRLSPLKTRDDSGQFIPFDYGYLAFVYDAKRNPELSKVSSFKQLLAEPKLKKRIVIEDPRTSSIGLSFLAWTKLVFPDMAKWTIFWGNFTPQLLTISSGWSGAYGLFLNGEADLVLSYTTSPAYHIEKENKNQYAFLNFSNEGGHFEQVEFVGMAKTSKNRIHAEKYIQFLLSEEIQKEIPTHQWMYPVIKGIPLPQSYSKLSVSNSVTTLVEEADRARWVQDWVRLQAM